MLDIDDFDRDVIKSNDDQFSYITILLEGWVALKSRGSALTKIAARG